MTLNELRYIVALARERHFSRAAEASFVSQPTLSVAVKKLEDELGVRLFERTKHDISPTPVGERIVEQAQQVLETVQRIRETAHGDADQLNGPLRLGAIYTIGPYLLPHLVPELHQRAPDMPLILEEGYTHELRRRLKQGELDAILISLPFEESGVVALPLYDEPFVAVLPSTHPFALREAIELPELAREDLLMLGPGHCFRDQIIEHCPECGRSIGTDGRPVLGGSSLETLRHMVASGLGVTILPCTAVGADRYAQRLLAVRRLAPPAPSRRVALAWRVSFPRPKAIETLRQAVLACPMSCVRAIKP